MEIDKTIQTSELLQKRLVKSVKQIEDEIARIVERILKQFNVENGRFVNDKTAKQVIATLNKEIRKLIGNNFLKTELAEFIDDFGLLDENIRAIHSDLNGIRISTDIFTAAKQWQMEYVVNTLREANVNLKFIAPVKQLLYSRVMFGSGLLDTEKQLRMLIKGDGGFGILQRWVGQVARDTINQYEGTINANVKTKYDLNAFRYVGPLVEDSRPQCRRWVKKGILLDSELKKEITWAEKYGSGLIPGTNPENFPVNRGGYNCIHKCYPTTA